jgi:ABC-type multidrug transport system fused ATPase/permease subunit
MTKFVAAQRRVSLKLSREKEQVMYDTVGGWKTVSYFNRMDHAQALYAASVRNNRRHWQSSEFREDVERGLQALVLNAGRLATFFFAVYQVMYNNKSVGSFVTLLSYWINLTSLSPPCHKAGCNR